VVGDSSKSTAALDPIRLKDATLRPHYCARTTGKTKKKKVTLRGKESGCNSLQSDLMVPHDGNSGGYEWGRKKNLQTLDQGGAPAGTKFHKKNWPTSTRPKKTKNKGEERGQEKIMGPGVRPVI